MEHLYGHKSPGILVLPPRNMPLPRLCTPSCKQEHSQPQRQWMRLSRSTSAQGKQQEKAQATRGTEAASLPQARCLPGSCVDSMNDGQEGSGQKLGLWQASFTCNPRLCCLICICYHVKVVKGQKLSFDHYLMRLLLNCKIFPFFLFKLRSENRAI